MRRAAYFAYLGNSFGRPFDDNVIRALLAADYDVDVYSPGDDQRQDLYPARVRRHRVEYRLATLAKECRPLRRREYDLLLGTADLPMALAGAIGTMSGRPTVTVADEIYVGGYEGNARTYWRHLARRGMHKSRLTVITDAARIPLQREYGRLADDHRFHVVPNCYAEPAPPIDRATERARLGIPTDAFVLLASGRFAADTGAHWAVRLLETTPPDVHLLVQTAGRPEPLTDALLSRLALGGRVTYVPERLPWLESSRVSAAADASLVFYLSQMPQFQAMGASSTKLCMALWLGQPVIALRQPSFQFIEQGGCGILIDREDELAAAVDRLRAGRFAANAQVAVVEHLRPAQCRDALAEVLRAL